MASRLKWLVSLAPAREHLMFGPSQTKSMVLIILGSTRQANERKQGQPEKEGAERSDPAESSRGIGFRSGNGLFWNRFGCDRGYRLVSD